MRSKRVQYVGGVPRSSEAEPTMVSSPRKGGGGVSIYFAILVFYATAGRHLLPSRLAEIPSSSPLLPERRRQQQQRRTGGAKERIPGEKRLDGMEAIIVDYEIGGGRDNDFLVHFDDILSRDHHRASNRDDASAMGEHHFAALVLGEDRAGTTRVYCRRSQMKSLSRGKYFVQMLRRGLERYPTRPMAHAIPILVKHDDSNGCYPATRSDKYGFPRLTWSMPANTTIDTPPSPRHGGEAPPPSSSSSSSTWCSAIGMPSYKIWKDVNQDNNDGVSSIFRMNNINALHRWSEKIPKAVWRGSTTCNKGIYGHLRLWDIPRSRLVESSLERPDLIDAGFHKLVGKYAGVASSSNARTRTLLKEPVPLNDMMKYKGKHRVQVIREWYDLFCNSA